MRRALLPSGPRAPSAADEAARRHRVAECPRAGDGCCYRPVRLRTPKKAGEPTLTESLLLDVTTASDEAVLYVRGEVDIATADQLRERLLTAYAEYARLVVDLSGAMFFDASGLRALHAVYREAVRHGRRPPILRGVRPLLAKSLKATGMYGLFTIEPGHQPGARSEAARRGRLTRHGASGRSTSSAAVAAASAA